MRRTGTTLIVLTVLVLLIAGGARRPAAQGGTPVIASPGASPVPGPVPPQECTVAPRSLESLAGLSGTPAGFGGTPAAGVAGTPAVATGGLPDPATGQPAGAATIGAVTAVLRQDLACTNAGENLRVFAVRTDRFIAELLGAGTAPALSGEIYAILATPLPYPPAQQVTLVAVEGVRVLPDGRVTAVVRTAAPEPRRSGVLFVPAGGSYLIDRVDRLPDLPPGTPAASPVASPAASPVASPVASPAASPVASPFGSPPA